MASKPMPAVRAATSRAIHWCGLVGLRAAGLRAALGERPSCEQMRCRHLLPTRRHIALARMSRCRPGVRQRVALVASLTASGRSCELCARTARVSHDQRAVWTASLAASGRSCCVLVEPASSLVIRRRSVETWGQVGSVARFSSYLLKRCAASGLCCEPSGERLWLRVARLLYVASACLKKES